MKKFLCIILIIVSMMSLCACEKKEKEEPAKETAATQPDNETNKTTESTEETTVIIQTCPPENIDVFPKLEYDGNYSVEKLTPNCQNHEIEKFVINGEEYNFQELTIEELHEDGYDTCGMAFAFVDNGYWCFTGIKYGLPNENGSRTDPINPIYIDTTVDGIISAISVDEPNTDAQFYKGLYVGMEENEATKLLEGATQGETFGEYCYILKTDKTTLIVDMEDGTVKEILLIKNENMQIWYQNQN